MRHFPHDVVILRADVFCRTEESAVSSTGVGAPKQKQILRCAQDDNHCICYTPILKALSQIRRAESDKYNEAKIESIR